MEFLHYEYKGAKWFRGFERLGYLGGLRLGLCI